MRFSAFVACAVLAAPRVAAATSAAALQAPQAPVPAAPQASHDTLFTARLNALVVTASRIDVPLSENPAATKVVGAEVLGTMSRGIAVNEALALVPGVKVDNQANGRRVRLSIRGQGILSEHGVRGTDVLLDGIPLNDPSGFAADLYDIDWPSVGTLQLQRGSGASLFGGGATAGVLSVTTEDGGPKPIAFQASGVSGSNGFRRGSGEAGGTLADVNYRVSYTHLVGDGYRVHTAFHGDNVYAKARWSPTPAVHLTPVVWYTDFFNQNAEGLNLTWLAADRRQANPDAITYNEYIQTRRQLAGVVGDVDLGTDRTLSFNGFVRRTAYRESVPSSVDHRTMTAPGATVQYTQGFSTGGLRHHVSVGTDLQWQTIDEFSLPNLGLGVEGLALLADQRLTQSGVGVFALDRIDLGSKWGAMLNVRYDRVGNHLADHLQSGGTDLSGSANFAQATGRVGLTFTPSPTLSLYGNLGQGFLPPATEELSANPDQIGGFNRNLKAAVSLGQEIGARGLLGRGMMFDLSVFHLETDRDFDRYRVTSRPLETFYRNAGASRRYGVETYLGWAPDAATLVQVAYTFSYFKYTNSTSAYGDVYGHWLPNSPAHQLYADGQVAMTQAFTVGASAELLSRWYVDPSNASFVNGYLLWHARATYRLTLFGTGIEATAAVRNIFAERYIAFTEPDPDGNSYQPAAEREFFVGLRLVP